ncbi:polyphosphate kinase 2 [Meridianimarinicoccus aquatilis]|uniref:ADP/GDP-polyphosphate phosphotransferase n=1 Tax=Meridianimarinicoccus aquatilis TaxID=2552766 RepID=A0A4R6AWR5_9RHOB|nr:polyphosphate kinase 2 [Fluviibacterium aquatile]QIE42556.1 polyphosphate kinase 2 [Rhodobacteraceae bacterium SC52]TDL89171.1 polyphosphate kinase 2 [Fluviibacterium aquatile]
MSKTHDAPAELPFEGAITRFFETEAPESVRKAIGDSHKAILMPPYPYDERMDKDEYEETLYKLQIELARFQHWVQKTGARVVVVFEGRDAAGKGGTIKRFRENMNPRVARVIALPKPTPTEMGQWYFQRYIAQLPTAGQIALFDRSWYNRPVVERVFDFCTTSERDLFFQQVPGFERALVQDGIHLVKIWLNVGQAEQLRRFLDREADPLKQWKLSQIDVDGLRRWKAYSVAIRETFDATHLDHAPWTIIKSDDKRRARIAAIRAVLSAIPYEGRNDKIVQTPDPAICGGPDIWDD